MSTVSNQFKHVYNFEWWITFLIACIFYTDLRMCCEPIHPGIHNTSTAAATTAKPLHTKSIHPHKRICHHLLPNKIWFMVHHKTGHHVSWAVSGVLKDYCHDRQISGSITTEFSIEKFLYHCKPSRCAYVHWVRHPLNTIISGIYYHLQSEEEWVRDWSINASINTAIDMDADLLYRDIIQNRVDDTVFYAKYRKEKAFRPRQRPSGTPKQRMAKQRETTSELTPCFDVQHHSVLSEQIKEFLDANITNNRQYALQLNMDVPLQAFYARLNAVDYRIGLFWEMIRYSNCEWPSMYVLQRIGAIYFDNVEQYDIDTWRNGKFDESMNRLLDQLNVMDSEQNRQKVGAEVNITRERMAILSALKRLDISENKETNNIHITHHQYDLARVIDEFLLLDSGICKWIKFMTLLLEFEWNYDTFC